MYDLIKEYKCMYLTCKILLRFCLTMKRIKDKTIYSYYGCKLNKPQVYKNYVKNVHRQLTPDTLFKFMSCTRIV